MNTSKRKKLLTWILGVTAALILLGIGGYFYLSGYFRAGNASEFSVANTTELPNSPITGKTIYFLGSSVTEGFAAHDESFADYIGKRNNCQYVKEGKSGTTMLDNGKSSFVWRLHNLDPKAKVDAFICQLSTNDTRYNGLEKLGKISLGKDTSGFDKTTTTGAMEYIIVYARAKWNCPVIFLTNTYFKNDDYSVVVKRLYEVQKKWNIEVFDLYNDKKLNALAQEKQDFYMLGDHVHPLRAGYKLWWTPYIEQKLYALMKDK